MLYAAIDIHKHAFQAAVLDPESGEVVEKRFSADRESLERWADEWGGRVAAVAIEATTGWRWVWREPAPPDVHHVGTEVLDLLVGVSPGGGGRPLQIPLALDAERLLERADPLPLCLQLAHLLPQCPRVSQQELQPLGRAASANGSNRPSSPSETSSRSNATAGAPSPASSAASHEDCSPSPPANTIHRGAVWVRPLPRDGRAMKCGLLPWMVVFRRERRSMLPP
jgi:hypothetical protein